MLLKQQARTDIGSVRAPRLSVMERLGVAMWTMRGNQMAPANVAREYRRFVEDAAFAESLGFESIWTSEHRFWYDGWCPALLHAEALAASATRSIRFGNAVLLAPQHDRWALARSALTLDRLTMGRVDLGLGLGHRDTEFDAVGLLRRRRGVLMDAALDAFADVWAGRHGDAPPTQVGGPPVWVGGMASAAIERAARRGHGLLLPPTLTVKQTRNAIEHYYTHGGPRVAPPRIGIVRDVHLADDARSATRFVEQLRRHYAEEISSWWVLKRRRGFGRAEAVNRQIDYLERSAFVGPSQEVASSLDELFSAGVTHVVIRANFEFLDPAANRNQLDRVATEVAPMLRAPAQP